MAQEQYDDNNPWHASANCLFAFICDNCHVEMGMDLSGKVGDGGPEFLDACVAISKRAQAKGWVCLGDWMFLCPKCALQRSGSSSKST